jgi:hypothetical protein
MKKLRADGTTGINSALNIYSVMFDMIAENHVGLRAVSDFN